MSIRSKSQSGKQILAMFKTHQKLYRRHILHIFVPEKKTPVQVIGLYLEKNGLIVLL